MSTYASNPVTLFLPLLNSAQLSVRQQAYALLLATYGGRGITMLRRLLSTNDLSLRRESSLALQHIGELSHLPINAEPFQGIYIECLGRTRIFVENRDIKIDEWVRQEHGRVGWHKLQGTLGYLLHCGRRGASQASLEAAVWGVSAAATIARTLQTLRLLFVDIGGETFAAQALTIADQHCLLSPEIYTSAMPRPSRSCSIWPATQRRQGTSIMLRRSTARRSSSMVARI